MNVVVHLYLGEDPGIALAVVEGPWAADWAKERGSIVMTPWQGDGSDFAYAAIADRPGLPDLIRAEGYDLDAADYEHVRVV